MSKLIIALFVAASIFSGSTPAASVPEVAMAKELMDFSLTFATGGKNDHAVSYATAARDLAGHADDLGLVEEINKVLHAYRATGLMLTAKAAIERHGESKAAVNVRALACKMAKESAPDVSTLLAWSGEFCSNAAMRSDENVERQVAVAAELANDAKILIRQEQVDDAVGYAQAALDIAQDAQDPTVIQEASVLLATSSALSLLLTTNLISTGQIATVGNDAGLAQEIKHFACAKVNEAPQEVRGLLASAEAQCGLSV